MCCGLILRLCFFHLRLKDFHSYFYIFTCSRRLFSFRHLLICDNGFVSDFRRFFMAPAEALVPWMPLLPPAPPLLLLLLLLLPLWLLLDDVVVVVGDDDAVLLLLPRPGLLLLLLLPPLPPPPPPLLSVFMLAQHGSDDRDSHGSAPKLLWKYKKIINRLTL